MEKSNKNDEFKSLDELCERIIELGERIFGSEDELDDDKKCSCQHDAKRELDFVIEMLAEDGVLVDIIEKEDKTIAIEFDFEEHDKRVIDEFIERLARSRR